MDEIREIKSMACPSEYVKKTFEPIAILLGVDTDWKTAKATMANPKEFLQRLENFDRDNVSDETLAKIKPYVDDPEFNEEETKKKSVALSAFCRYTLQVYDYAINKANINQKS